MDQQELGDLIARCGLGDEQDSQATAQPEGQPEVIACMSLRLEDSELFEIGARQAMVKHIRGKLESGPLGVESARSLESSAVSAIIGQLCVREENPFRPPSSAAELPHDAKRRSDIGVVDLFDVFCTFLIDHGTERCHPVFLQQKRGHALTVEMLVNGECSDCRAHGRRASRQPPWQAEMRKTRPLAHQQSEVPTPRPHRTFVQQPAHRNKRDPILNRVEAINVKAGLGHDLCRVDPKLSKETWKLRQQ
ncbi:MAG TPA: hypothetical protein VLL57_01095, partial [Candidatus Binataceae bacterium]|nr:hypothetical protein [Candidatus Binataceae bacterium]